MKNYIAKVAMITCFGLFLTACETMEGFGRDVEKTGEKIEDSADR